MWQRSCSPQGAPDATDHRAQERKPALHRGYMTPHPCQQAACGAYTAALSARPHVTPRAPCAEHCLPPNARKTRPRGIKELPHFAPWPRSPGASLTRGRACGPALLCSWPAGLSTLQRARLIGHTRASDLLHKKEVTEVPLLTRLPGSRGKLRSELISPENRRKHRTSRPCWAALRESGLRRWSPL